MKKLFILILLLLFIAGCSTVIQKEDMSIDQRIMLFSDKLENGELSFKVPRGAKIDTFLIDNQFNVVSLFFNKNFSYLPFREENVNQFYKIASAEIFIPEEKFNVKVYTNGYPVEELIPNFFRKDKKDYISAKQAKPENRPVPVIQKTGEKYVNGLHDKNLIVWHSHGWYYSYHSQRWEWQRPRLYQTVEDLIPMSFTVPFIVPMLENAGATVFVPRERDLNKNEAVVDNNSPDLMGVYKENTSEGFEWENCEIPGFAYGNPPYDENFNPFGDGTARKVKVDSKETASVIWSPEIKETAEYAVYISWQADNNNITDAHYTVYHEGGSTEFYINQQIGGATWFYLGHFKFKTGKNVQRGVKLSNKSSGSGKYITADAVRFGGGMGLVKRNGVTSGRPKFAEGARYWLQYAGMPDTLIYNLHNNTNDYGDDYKSRAEYANYLYGAPFGPNINRSVKGMGIPMDASIAFHTDAGITRNDTTVGTLMIYSSTDLDTVKTFPDGVSRQSNRDFADIMQTQIVDDIRAKYDPAWNRRQLMDALYSESFRPNFPGVLIELLSHQNFLDMKFMLDPSFRFDVSRSIYKSVVKFLATHHSYDYVIQPLPVNNFSGGFTEKNAVKLSWKPVADPLEPTASADKYIVYTRINDGGFDNGILTDKPELTIENLKAGYIYSFKVEAVNKGGKSFPSEILAFGIAENAKDTALVVNGFDRIDAPYSFRDTKYGGFVNIVDNGVPYKYDLGFTGEQTDFRLDSEFLSNDAPGHGASFGDYETEIIAGNTFDYPYIHGKALLVNGYSFVSKSDESVMNSTDGFGKYSFVDLILGEEKESFLPREEPAKTSSPRFQTFPKELIAKIKVYLDEGGKMLISGAHIATGLLHSSTSNEETKEFAEKYLKLRWRSNHASRKGELFVNNINFGTPFTKFNFNTEYSKDLYRVEAADAFEPIEGESYSLLRYHENRYGAAVGFNNDFGVVSLGFPFETINSSEQRNELMKLILKFLSE